VRRPNVLRTLLAVSIMVLMPPSGSGRAQQVDPPARTEAQKAAQTYQSAVSALRTRQYKQAEGLFDKYVTSYATHEYVPVGYLLLAQCRSQLQDQPGYEKALTEVTRRYAGSPAWFTAYRYLLGAARKAKDPDRYFQLLETMLRVAPQAPWRMQGSIAWTHGEYMRRAYQQGFLRPKAGQLASFLDEPGWVMGVAEMADTEARARGALELLAKNFQTLQKELPPDWQHVHVALLRRAGKADQAEEAWARYAGGWGDDPRRIVLWEIKLNEAIAAKDAPAAAEAFAGLTDGLTGSAVLERSVYDYLVWLSGLKRQDEFERIARQYLKAYPLSYDWHRLVQLWVATARPPRGQEPSAERVASVLKMLDEVYDTGDPARERSELIWRIDLLLSQGEKDQAAALASKLILPEHWSKSSFEQVARYAADPAFAPVLQAAREKWNIPLPNPTSKAFIKLHELKRRLAADQIRHAEEIGEELFGAHRQNASTIEAVKLLVDYYFQKVLPAPRDKWMDRMVETWPTHPATQDVLAAQITAENAARRYDRLAKAIDTIEERFGGTRGKWYERRLACFRVANDPAGALAYVQKVFGLRAEAGDAWAMDFLGRYELAANSEARDFKAIGEYWMARAWHFAGKSLETACLRRAWSGYYWTPLHSGAADRIDYEAATAAVRAMQTQTRDPVLKWQMAFGEVNLLAQKGDGRAAADALDKTLADAKTCRDLSLRVDLALLGSAMGKSGLVKRGADLAERLERMCFTTRDRCAIEVMLASMYSAREDHRRAAEHYANAVKAYPFPARMLPTFQAALSCLRSARSRAYPATLEGYLRQVERVQEIVPVLLHDAGRYYAGLRSSAALDVRKRLASSYPASRSRDRLEEYLETLYQQHRRNRR